MAGAVMQHPDPATLVTCSAGSQPEALCAVVASHISICPTCLRELLDMEKIGVALFEGLEPEPLSHAHPPMPTGIETVRTSAPALRASAEVPRPIRKVVGGELDSLEWSRLRDGVDHFAVDLSPHARGDLRLIRLCPGASLPEHGHSGEELTLVLRGAFRDETGTFSAGDFADLDDETRHTVTATEDGECILLIASEGKPAFLEAGPT